MNWRLWIYIALAVAPVVLLLWAALTDGPMDERDYHPEKYGRSK